MAYNFFLILKTKFKLTFIKKYPEYLLFLLFSIIGIFTVNSYGTTWDENDQRDIGLACYNYIFNNDVFYRVLESRDHGAIFEVLLVIIEKIGGLTISKDIYIMRHIVSHLFFILSAFYFYKLIFLIYNNKKLALFGFLLLVINPTIYGHSFFNSKDVPFLSMLIICFYQFALAFKQKKYYQFLLLAIFSSLLINIRIMGIMFVSFVLFFLLLDLIIFYKEKGSIKKHILFTIIFSVSIVIFTIATWPLLWEKPLQNFKYAVGNLSKFPWPGTNLFKGENISANHLSWDYIPTWFIINTPIIYLILGFSGLILFAFHTLKHLKTFDLKNIDKNNLLYLLSFLAPVIVVIYLNSVLYDSWRHLFYIYPAFILLAIYFINFYIKTKYKSIVSLATIISISATSFFIISNFPFHHVYFNQFVSLHKDEYIRKNYEMDYWGVSYNKALEYILEIDKRDTIYIVGQNPPCLKNTLLLTENEKKRLKFTYVEHPDYFITNYRKHPNDYDEEGLEEIKSFTVLGNKINTIFKYKK